LWERLFEPFQTEVMNGSVAKDLIALGTIAFHLLIGRAIDEKGQLLQPKQDALWVGVDPALKKYVLRLLELDLPFENAADARRTLLQMPIDPVLNQFSPDAEVLVKKKPLSNIVKALIIALLLAAFGKLAMTLVKPAPAAEAEPPICCMKEVGGMPIGEYTYTAVENGIWDKFVNQTGLEGVPTNQRLKEYLKTAQPQLKLNYQSVDSVKAAIARVRSGKAAFAIVPMIKELPDDLTYQEIAHDALAVFVNFSYSERDKGLPTALKGQLTLEQLQEIYTGEVKDWQEISKSELPIKRYAPLDGESINLFEQKVLADQEAIATFREHLNQPQPDDFTSSKNNSKIEQLPTLEMLRTSIQDFESDQTGGIGFAPLSQVFGQCSVYPLALAKSGQPSVQALTLTDGQAIDPTVDLCDRKGSYGVLPELIKSGQYPLSYGIAIIYTRDNSRSPVGEKFAEMLKSTEGQKLLSQFGLLPL
jgi:hypothetical protein